MWVPTHSSILTLLSMHVEPFMPCGPAYEQNFPLVSFLLSMAVTIDPGHHFSYHLHHRFDFGLASGVWRGRKILVHPCVLGRRYEKDACASGTRVSHQA